MTPEERAAILSKSPVDQKKWTLHETLRLFDEDRSIYDLLDIMHSVAKECGHSTGQIAYLLISGVLKRDDPSAQHRAWEEYAVQWREEWEMASQIEVEDVDKTSNKTEFTRERIIAEMIDALKHAAAGMWSSKGQRFEI